MRRYSSARAETRFTHILAEESGASQGGWATTVCSRNLCLFQKFLKAGTNERILHNLYDQDLTDQGLTFFYPDIPHAR